MPAPATHTFVHLEVSSASVLNTSVNGPINYAIGRELGSDDAVQIEDSLEIMSGSNGNHYLRIPQGTTGQRPTRDDDALLRFNTALGNLDFYDGSDWMQPLTNEVVTFEALDANGDVGGGAAQLAPGAHSHTLSVIRSKNFDTSSTSANVNMAEMNVAELGLSSGTYTVIAIISAVTGNQGAEGTLVVENTTPSPDAVLMSADYDIAPAATDDAFILQFDHTFDGTEVLRVAMQNRLRTNNQHGGSAIDNVLIIAELALT